MKLSTHIKIVVFVMVVFAAAFGFLGWTTAIGFLLLGSAALAIAARTRGVVQGLAIVVTTAGYTLCAVECVAIVIEPHFSGTNEIGHRDKIGWGPVAAGQFHMKRMVAGQVQYDATYTIDDRLLRKTISNDTGDDGVAFFGDSFIYGTGLNDDETLPQYFADDMGRAFPVFNMGVPGWSPAQVLAELQSGLADDILKRSRLVVFFVPPWHAERMACESVLGNREPRYTLVDGKPQPAGPCPPLKKSPFAIFAFYRVFIAPHQRTVSDADVRLLEATVDETIKIVTEKYKLPIIVYYLRDPNYLKKLPIKDDQLMASFAASGARLLDYTIANDDSTKYRIKGDGHPTALANRIRAERLAAFVRATFPAFGEGARSSAAK